ncbi:DNA cytosine methyltransferase [Candidatus Parcubacteria bacterium]|nr:MAG: DNA cytosine methyltransferase [Candidatus Parcubacteria bacterium]
MSVSRLRCIDLFAGTGGLSLGFKKAGFRILRAYDAWPEACENYNANFDHRCECADLSDDSVHDEIVKLEPDLIIGGPPCQDFSHAGTRNDNGERAQLTVSFAEIIKKARPSYFVMENVDRTAKRPIYLDVKQELSAIGYGLTEAVLDASLCGAPQKRRRLFLIGAIGESDDFLAEALKSGLASKPLTVREYFGDELNTEFYYRHPRNYNRRAIFSIDEPSPTIRGVNRPIPPNYPVHKNDACHDLTKVRPLTFEERARIQTFPKDFKWIGSKTTVEQMIGNAVPVNLARYVAEKLKEHIQKSAAAPSLCRQEQMELIEAV